LSVLLACVVTLVALGDATAQQAKGEPVQIGVVLPLVERRMVRRRHQEEGAVEEVPARGQHRPLDVVLVGFPVFNGLLANKLQIGYLGDAPAMVGTTKRETADLRIVSLNHWSPGNICAIVLVRPDAPDLKTPQEWLGWLNGKKFGVAGRASCGDRFTSFLETRQNVKFGEKLYLGARGHQDPAPGGYRSTRPSSSSPTSPRSSPRHRQDRLHGCDVELARGLALLMRKDFIDKHYEAAKGWVKADLEALRYILENPREVSQMVAEELPGWTPPMVLTALNGKFPPHAAAGDVNEILGHPFDAQDAEVLPGRLRVLARGEGRAVGRYPRRCPLREAAGRGCE
jgi:NitT/TauT family transport system substrate-binding protein